MFWIDRAKDLRDRFTDLLTKHGKGLEVFWVYAPPKRGASRINLEEFPRFLSLDEAVTVSFNQAGSLWVFGDQAAWKSWLSLAGLALSVLKAPEAKEVVKVLPDVRGEVEVLLLACFKILRPPKFCFHKDSTVERKSLREFQTVFPGDASKRFNRRRWWAKLDVIEATVLVLDRLLEAAQLASAPTLPAVSAQEASTSAFLSVQAKEAPVTAESQSDIPLSQTAQNVLLVLKGGKAFDSDSRIPVPEIAKNAKQAKSLDLSAYYRAVASLKKACLVGTKSGWGGGVWLTSAGKDRAEQV